MNGKSDHDLIIEIHAVLLGTNGSPGLCSNFENHKKEDEDFQSDYFKFKRWVIGIACFMAGAGVLGYTGVKLAEVLHL